MPIFFQSLSKADLRELLFQAQVHESLGERPKTTEAKLRSRSKVQASQLFKWIYQRHVFNFDDMSDISKAIREWLKANVTIYIPKVFTERQAIDGTYKFLWQLEDSKTIESVIIPSALRDKKSIEGYGEDHGDEQENESQDSEYAGAAVDRSANDLKGDQWARLTACISSQVGCAMACKFCLTGIQGLDRHLQAHEIVGQVLALRTRAPITNIVFMGMGEPLHNLENVIKACEILLDEEGLNFSKRKVTVSTSGLVPAIDELGKRTDVSLAISLNGSNDDQRESVMPVNKRWPLNELLAACRRYPLGSHRRITFEYVLLSGVNDADADAARVVKLLRNIPSKVNLIPFNEHSGSSYKRPNDERVKSFQSVLLKSGVTATVRISRGRDILAACGQLRSVFGTARGTERHKDYPQASTPAVQA